MSSSSSDGPEEEMEMVELGYVSNELDYVSRGLNIKLASCGREKKTEYVYVIHGVFCNIAKTLKWLVEMGVRGEDGRVFLARDFLLGGGEERGRGEEEGEGMIVVPYKWRVRLNKHGKRIALDIEKK